MNTRNLTQIENRIFRLTKRMNRSIDSLATTCTIAQQFNHESVAISNKSPESGRSNKWKSQNIGRIPCSLQPNANRSVRLQSLAFGMFGNMVMTTLKFTWLDLVHAESPPLGRWFVKPGTSAVKEVRKLVISTTSKVIEVRTNDVNRSLRSCFVMNGLRGSPKRLIRLNHEFMTVTFVMDSWSIILRLLETSTSLSY